MISAQLCNCYDKQPFHHFVTNTVTCVCVPDQAQGQLILQLSEPCRLSIEVDGEEVFQERVDPIHNCVPLARIFPPASGQSQSLLSAMPRPLSFSGKPVTCLEAREFTTLIHREGPVPTLAATFAFHLLPPGEYEVVYQRYLQLQSKTGSAVTAVRERPMPPEQYCWHCARSIDQSICPHCGAEQ